MTIKKALKILEGCSYIGEFIGEDTVVVDGAFDSEQLKAIAFLLDKKYEE